VVLDAEELQRIVEQYSDRDVIRYIVEKKTKQQHKHKLSSRLR